LVRVLIDSIFIETKSIRSAFRIISYSTNSTHSSIRIIITGILLLTLVLHSLTTLELGREYSTTPPRLCARCVQSDED